MAEVTTAAAPVRAAVAEAGAVRAASSTTAPSGAASVPRAGGTIAVRYFAAAAEATGRDEEDLAVAGGTIGDLRAALLARYGEAIGAVVRTGSFLVDGTVETDDEAPLAARVDVLPPFAGG